MVPRNVRKLVTAASLALMAALPLAVSAKDERPKIASSFDWSDLWWTPAESGWGMQLVQEAGTVFATLFVYGADGKPAWYIGVLTVGAGNALSGPMYATTGPYFGGIFNPTATTVHVVGTMAIIASSTAAAQLNYVVDGATVVKQVERQSIALDNYSGLYAAVVVTAASGCTAPNLVWTDGNVFGLTITQTGTNISLLLEGAEQDSASCTYSGTYTQTGKFGNFTGPYSCDNGEVGTMSFLEMTNRIGMFSGRFSGQSSNLGCRYTGRIIGITPFVQ